MMSPLGPRLAEWTPKNDMSLPPVTFWNHTTDGCYKSGAIDETLTAGNCN